MQKHHEERAVAAQIAAEHALPSPTAFINSGQDASVFATTDPRWVVRVGDLLEGSRNEELFLDKDFADGLTRVLHMEWRGEYIVTWKERVDEYVLGFLKKRLRPKRADQIAYALTGLYHCDRRQLRTLKSWKGTRGLAEAIEAGMPTSDLDLNSNLGVTRDGRIVAFDL